LGTAAARLLLQRIQGLKLPPKRVVLPTELKIRNSVANVELGVSKRRAQAALAP
jgi:DNA-binding LacI/PurR family transcriptional regulator